MSNRNWPKIRKRKIKVKKREYSYYVVDLGVVDGKRKFIQKDDEGRSFKKRKDAERYAGKKRIERNRIGNDALRLTDQKKRDAVQASNILNGSASLIEAAEFFSLHHNPAVGQCTVNELLKEYVAVKIRANRRWSTVHEIGDKIGRFAKDFGDILVYKITTYDLEKWLDSHGYTKITRSKYRTLFIGFFNYALKHGRIKINPGFPIEKPILDEKLPEILTVTEVQKLLSTAQTEKPEIVPYFAVALFAGIRPNEIQQLDWQYIDFSEKLITLRPEVAKKRRQRHVEMSDNLITWLLPYRKKKGTIYYQRKDFDYVRLESKVRWSPNVLRHSYGSYHLAMHENAAKTSLQMGHMRPDILFDHYRELVKRKDAEKYWNIYPDKQAQVIEFVKAG